MCNVSHVLVLDGVKSFSYHSFLVDSLPLAEQLWVAAVVVQLEPVVES